jgi:hypothetical protein
MPGSLTCNTPRDDEEVTVKYGNLKTLEDERNAYADAADEFERQNALLKAEIEQLKHEKRKAEADTKHEKREKEIMIEKRDGLRLSNEVLMPSIEILIGFPKASKRSYSETKYVNIYLSSILVLIHSQPRSHSYSAPKHHALSGSTHSCLHPMLPPQAPL